MEMLDKIVHKRDKRNANNVMSRKLAEGGTSELKFGELTAEVHPDFE